MYYKLMKLVSGMHIIGKVVEEKKTTTVLENPMEIQISFNEESRPQFKYLPWQLIAESKQVTIDNKNILLTAAPKSELLTVYLNICTSFEKAGAAAVANRQPVGEIPVDQIHEEV